jgi:hypothetical protein
MQFLGQFAGLVLLLHQLLQAVTLVYLHVLLYQQVEPTEPLLSGQIDSLVGPEYFQSYHVLSKNEVTSLKRDTTWSMY